jgi:hypothetical protein
MRGAALTVQRKFRQFLDIQAMLALQRHSVTAHKLEAIRRRLVLLRFRVHLRGKVIRMKIAKSRRAKNKRRSAEPPRVSGWMEKYYSNPADQLPELPKLPEFTETPEAKTQNLRPDIIDVEELPDYSEEALPVIHPFYRGKMKRYLMPTTSYKNKWRTAEFIPPKDKEHDPQGFLDILEVEESLEPLFISPMHTQPLNEVKLTRPSRNRAVNYMSPTYCSRNTFSFEESVAKQSSPVNKFKHFLRPTTVSQMKSAHQQAKKARLTLPVEYRCMPRTVPITPVIPTFSPKPRRLKPTLPCVVQTPKVYEETYSSPRITTLSFEEALPSLHKIVEWFGLK